MIPAHHTESKMSPATQGVLPSGDYKEIRSVRVGSSSGARELFTRALRETADSGPGSDTEPSCHVDPNDGFGYKGAERRTLASVRGV